MAVSRSSAARVRASFTVRTAWPSFRPASQIGYQSGLGRAAGQAPGGVEQEEVEVAAGRQLAPAVAADGHEGQALRTSSTAPSKSARSQSSTAAV